MGRTMPGVLSASQRIKADREARAVSHDPIVVFDRRQHGAVASAPIDEEVTAAFAAGGGWIFSSDLDESTMEEVGTLIDMNQLRAVTSEEDKQARAAAAEDAFERMVPPTLGHMLLESLPLRASPSLLKTSSLLMGPWILQRRKPFNAWLLPIRASPFLEAVQSPVQMQMPPLRGW